jgi:4-diphosphocytidyl-2-C-methyl-D-erythritol kinase
MLEFPNAKINIGLNITEKRPDGFHNIETIFYPINLTDILEVQIKGEQGATSFTNTGLEVDVPFKDNIVYKTLELIRQIRIIPEVNIHLHKIIPFGSGLGGGSSDAVSMIKMLNRIFSLETNEEQLIEYAGRLGSDCPFFFKNTPQYASEKGDKLEPVNLSLSGYYLFLIIPDIQISTRFAYQGVTPKKSDFSLKKCIEETPVKEWKNHIKNDFEEHIFEHHTGLKKLKDMLYDSGAVFASMSGSGAAIYGIFESPPPELNLPKKYFTWQEKLI